MRVELHCHTTRSDGADTPEALHARAAPRGLAVFAITDHDTVTPCALDGVRCLRAAEITCDDRGATLHVLAYERGGGDWAALDDAFAEVRRQRRNRLVPSLGAGEGNAEIQMSCREIRPRLRGPPAGRDRFVEPARPQQRVAETGMNACVAAG